MRIVKSAMLMAPTAARKYWFRRELPGDALYARTAKAVDEAVAHCGKMCEPLENNSRRWRRETSFG